METTSVETALLRGRVRVLQPEKGFRASIDAVFLAAAVQAKEGQKILDIGCGVGSAGLCVMARVSDLCLTGLDVQEELIALARRNATLNGIAERCDFFHSDILTDCQIPDNTFHAVLMNPPYQEAGTHIPSPHSSKAVAHGEGEATLLDWIRYAHRKVKQGGYLTLIHRADRLDDILRVLVERRWFGSIVVLPLHSHAGEDAKRVIVRARKERYAPLALKAGLIIHKDGGGYADWAEDVLSKACPLG